MASLKAQYSTLIKEEAQRLGFSACGISKAAFLEEEAPRLEQWLKNGYHGTMKWMENHFDKRLDPTKLVEGSKSVVSLLFNYFPEEDLFASKNIKISKYAYAEDYHFVLKDKMADLMYFIQENIGDVSGRAFVDSAPVLDRIWAKKAGLGWIGKHSLLLSKQKGSFFFIGELIIDLDLEPDGPTTDHCGKCTACIDACPTEAIVEPFIIDSNKCISYLTIELRDEIPNTLKGEMKGWAYGCDICQDACPWNRFSKPHQEDRFKPSKAFSGMTDKDWQEITEEVFKRLTKKSAIKRTKYLGLKRNIDFLT